MQSSARRSPIYMFSRLILIAAFAGLGLACAESTTEGIATNDLRFGLSVVTELNKGTQCVAAFYSKDSTTSALELDENSSVKCGETVMAMKSTDGGPMYFAPATKKGDGSIDITFFRKDEPAYVSSTTVPDPLRITRPIKDIRKGEDLVIEWERSTSIEDFVEGNLYIAHPKEPRSYYFPQGDPQPEVGELTIGDAVTSSQPFGAGDWPATLTIGRSRFGTMAGGLNGEIKGTQILTYNFKLLQP